MSVMCGHCKTKHSTPYDVYLCSRNARRSDYRQVVSAPAPNPLAYPFKAPESMVAAIREGRYAVDVGRGTQRVIFVRISRPTKGKLKGCLKIQTQHSDYYKDAAVRYPSGSWRVFTTHKTDLDAALTVIAINPLDAALLYARELDACSRCGRELTDERSRYYSIGPECEKHWPDMITKINNEKGTY